MISILILFSHKTIYMIFIVYQSQHVTSNIVKKIVKFVVNLSKAMDTTNDHNIFVTANVASS